jgi:DNA-binding NarL/FixJ family response regulator
MYICLIDKPLILMQLKQFKTLIICILFLSHFGTKADTLGIVKLLPNKNFFPIQSPHILYFATNQEQDINELHLNWQNYFRRNNRIDMEKKENWLRFEVDNQQENQAFALDAAQNWHTEVFIFDEKSHQARRVAYGINIPIEQRTFSYTKWRVPIQLAKGKHTIYVRYQGLKELVSYCDCKFDFLAISTTENLWQQSIRQFGIVAFIAGILLIMSFYNLVIYLFVRDKIYLFYVLGCVFFSLFFVVFKTSEYMHWFLSSSLVANFAVGFSNTCIAIAVFFLYKFMEAYLEGVMQTDNAFFRFFKKYKYSVLLINLPIYLAAWLSFLHYIKLDTNFWLVIANSNFAFICVLMIVVSRYAWRSKHILGKYFVYANLIFFVLALAELLSDKYLGLYAGNMLSYNGVSLGFSFQLTAFSLALAQRIQSLKKQVLQQELQQEKIKREHLEELQKLILAQNEYLEAKVKERTYLLEQSNEEIRTQASQIQAQAQALEEINSRELMNKTLQILQKNETLSDILKFMDKIKPNLQSEEEKNNCKIIIRLIKESIDADKQWEDFKEYFEKVYPTLFNEMHKLCPTLTQNDLRLCAYLRMGLNRKEIAQMLNINVESVRKHIYRLKIKLGQDVEELYELKN